MGRWVSAARRLQRCETRTPCGLAERHVEADVLDIALPTPPLWSVDVNTRLDVVFDSSNRQLQHQVP